MTFRDRGVKQNKQRFISVVLRKGEKKKIVCECHIYSVNVNNYYCPLPVC